MSYQLRYINAHGAYIDFSRQSRCIISDITGLTENYINIAESQGINQVGSTIQGESVQPKNIVVNGEILGQTKDLRQKMLEIISPATPGRLIFNGEWELEVSPTVTPIIQRNLINAKFQFTLRAPYPYWRRAAASNVMLSGFTPLFRFPWNISNTTRFSKRMESVFANIENRGNVPAKFVVRFTAKTQLTAPQIIKVATREFIRIDKELEAGEVITVDMTGGGVTITSNIMGIETDAFGYLDIDSSLFLLDVGDNIIRDSADENAEGLSTMIIMRDTISGVWV